MKKFISLLLVMLLITSCANKAGNNQSTENKEGKKVVYTSFYPIEFATKEIVKDKMDVKSVIPAGVEVHDWEPSLKDITKIKESDLVLINGLELEDWLDDAKKVVDEKKIVEVSKDIELIKPQEEDHDHDHDEHDHDHEEENHEEENHEGHHHHNHGEYDPHIWLSIRNYEVIAKNIFEEVSKIDPENRGFYEENYNSLKKSLEELDKKYTDGFKENKGKHIIVPHEAFGYMAKDYNLVQVPIENITSDSEPDLKTIANIVDLAKKEGIKTVFYEGEDSGKVPKTIAKEIGGEAKPIHTLEFITDEQEKNGDNYLTLMEENFNNIMESFK
ncbi:zinc ABC transporter substrate-binding protein [Lagierella sp.]|uniref:metal ABC transporter substrate-binding protein n=1 Tax=Lagierella sp. TaxID=2849657 RepID=UPI002630ED6C|nr:zinc ABC transporter substrate-binding protein [Lagierella sp.]